MTKEDIPYANILEDVEPLKTDTVLDELTGIYGLPKGRITEFWGEENTGKSTAALQVVAAVQKEGVTTLWIDVEHSFDPKYARSLGVDLSKLGFIEAVDAETYLDKTLDAIKSGKWGVIVMDSIGSLSSRAEMEKSLGESTIGKQASLMSRLVRQMVGYVKQYKTVFIGVNHQRKDFDTGRIYQMGGQLWSDKKKLSIRFRTKSGMVIKQGDRVIGKVIRLNVTKNHIGATEGMEKEFHLINGEGYSFSANLLQEALDRGVITKQGNVHYFGDEKLGMVSKVREMMKDESFLEKLKAVMP